MINTLNNCENIELQYGTILKNFCNDEMFVLSNNHKIVLNKTTYETTKMAFFCVYKNGRHNIDAIDLIDGEEYKILEYI